MNLADNKVLVEVDIYQKDVATVDGVELYSGQRYNENFREKNPVVAEIIQGHGIFEKGKWIVCNYTYFDWSSPFLISANRYCIPVDQEIFAFINSYGSLEPIMGNLICERVVRPTYLKMPDDFIKNEFDRGWVAQGNEEFKTGDFVFWLKMADYEIVYPWKGIERKAIKVHESEIFATLKK